MAQSQKQKSTEEKPGPGVPNSCLSPLLLLALHGGAPAFICSSLAMQQMGGTRNGHGQATEKKYVEVVVSSWAELAPQGCSLRITWFICAAVQCGHQLCFSSSPQHQLLASSQLTVHDHCTVQGE